MVSSHYVQTRLHDIYVHNFWSFYSGPVLIASPAGGVDIEAVAAETPHLLKTVPINIEKGLSDKTCVEIAEFLEFKGTLVQQAAKEIKKLYELFNRVDAVQIEINPFAETDDGRVISVDAKLNFDDNAKYRQQNIFDMEVKQFFLMKSYLKISKESNHRWNKILNKL